ncbi:MAG: 50S ribosomal protein L3 [Candidatus Schekmanbacteria bacterium]|nr:50S ribosomal protein L3 [Candidatus Schekmanbacteria bacterium]
MTDSILARKIGMTQVYADDGSCIPVTVLKAGPCIVVNEKTQEKDGYAAVQIGLVEKEPKNLVKPLAGYFKQQNVAPVRVLREIKPKSPEKYAIGTKVTVEQIFNPGDRVNVIGTSKGKGFAGGVKRHGFRGGPATHGSMFHRAPGSIGSSSYPSRVYKGQRLPGHMGHERVTVENLKVVDVLKNKDLILIRGAVPGTVGSLVIINKMS